MSAQQQTENGLNNKLSLLNNSMAKVERDTKAMHDQLANDTAVALSAHAAVVNGKIVDMKTSVDGHVLALNASINGHSGDLRKVIEKTANISNKIAFRLFKQASRMNI